MIVEHGALLDDTVAILQDVEGGVLRRAAEEELADFVEELLQQAPEQAALHHGRGAAEIAQHLVGVVHRVDLVVASLELPVRTDDRGDAVGVALLRAVRGSERQRELTVGIREQRERVAVLLAEDPVRDGLVEGSAENDDVPELLVVTGSITEPVPFDASAGCVGLRVEPDDESLAAELAQGSLRTGLVGQGELGNAFADLDHADRIARCPARVIEFLSACGTWS